MNIQSRTESAIEQSKEKSEGGRSETLDCHHEMIVNPFTPPQTPIQRSSVTSRHSRSRVFSMAGFSIPLARFRTPLTRRTGERRKYGRLPTRVEGFLVHSPMRSTARRRLRVGEKAAPQGVA